MNEFFMQSSFVGVIMCLAAFLFGKWINQKTKLPFLNPLLIAIVIIAAFLVIFHVDYEAFNYSAKYVNYLITPATVALAVPLYTKKAHCGNNDLTWNRNIYRTFIYLCNVNTLWIKP